jgi:hypothetical protein
VKKEKRQQFLLARGRQPRVSAIAGDYPEPAKHFDAQGCHRHDAAFTQVSSTLRQDVGARTGHLLQLNAIDRAKLATNVL